MNSPYSDEVERYTAKYVKAFQPSPDDMKWAEQQVWPQRWRLIGLALLSIFAGCAAIWVIAAVIGWVVRGFTGIPTGSDAKPNS